MPGYLKLAIGYFIFSIIALLVARYLVPVELAFGGTSLFITFLLSILVMVVLGRKYLRNSDYLLNFGEALKGLFIGTLLATVLSMFVTVAIYNGDAVYQEKFNKVQIENSIGAMGFGMKVAGMSEEDIALEKEEFRAKIESGEEKVQEFPMTWSNLPMLLLTSIISVLIYSLLASIFVKQKQNVL